MIKSIFKRSAPAAGIVLALNAGQSLADDRGYQEGSESQGGSALGKFFADIAGVTEQPTLGEWNHDALKAYLKCHDAESDASGIRGTVAQGASGIASGVLGTAVLTSMPEPNTVLAVAAAVSFPIFNDTANELHQRANGNCSQNLVDQLERWEAGIRPNGFEISMPK